ncbi:MAG: secretin N-terminal domain-containing protein, partial [Armatimonadota bacterium]
MKTPAWFAVAAFVVFAGSCLANSPAQQKEAVQLPQPKPSKELLVMLEDHPALPLGPYWVPDWLRDSWKAPFALKPSIGGVEISPAPMQPTIERYVGLPSARPSLGEIGKKPVTLEIDRTDASEAIMNLLEAVGASYVVGGDIPAGRRITARFRNVPLQDALDALAEAAGLSYSLKGNVIVLRATGFLSVTTTPPLGIGPPMSLPPTPPAKPKLNQPKPQPQTKPQSKPGAGQKSSSLSEKSSTTSFIALSHTSAPEVLQRLSTQSTKLPPGLEVVAAAPDGNAVVARGTRDALQELRKAIAALDVPVKVVEVQASVFTVPESGLKAALPERFLFQPEFVLSELEAEQIIGKLKSSGAVALCQ